MQRELWEKEYKELLNLPSSRTMHPSVALVNFVKSHPDLTGRALDIGSGKGRNAIYLAKLGFEVVGIEVVKYARKVAEEEARKAKVDGVVRFLELSAGEPLPFEDESFDLIVDMMTLHLLNSRERLNYQKEIIRLLKPGKFFLFYTLAAENLAAQELCKSSPGPEENSYIVPESGVVEKCFTEEELAALFSPLTVVNLSRHTMLTKAFDGHYKRDYYTGVLRKPQILNIVMEEDSC